MRFLGHFCAAALLICSASAFADTFSFSFTGQDTGSGTFTAEATGTSGEYLITDISGKMNGNTITGLLAPDSYPAGDPPENDNLLYDPAVSGSYLDEDGVGFTLSNGKDVDIYYDNGYFIIKGTDDSVNTLASFSVTADPVAATPEPSSLLLLGTGLMGVVGTLRRRLA